MNRLVSLRFETTILVADNTLADESKHRLLAEGQMLYWNDGAREWIETDEAYERRPNKEGELTYYLIGLERVHKFYIPELDKVVTRHLRWVKRYE